MRHWIRQRLPTEDTLKAHPSLRWLGPWLRRPWLWQLNRRRVALGAGIGVFFGFIVPVAQSASPGAVRWLRAIHAASNVTTFNAAAGPARSPAGFQGTRAA